MPASTRADLRKSLRRKRRQLSASSQHIAASKVCRQIAVGKLFLAAQRIAFYLPVDGEIDPSPLIRRALKMGKSCYLPVLAPNPKIKLGFSALHLGDLLVANRWGIYEPADAIRNLIPAWSLDLVFTPLVGFDVKGSRLGMGKGYYDRTFSFKSTFNRARPTLVGLAHECQKLEDIPIDHWDVPLDMIVSDKEIYTIA